MRFILPVWVSLAFFLASAPEGFSAVDDSREIRLADTPSLSPDGSQLAFSWLGEIWTSNIDGSEIRRLTNNDALDTQPLYSPDGSKLAFVSSRTGARQIFVMDANGESLKQLTFHSEGYSLEDWFPDGNSILATGQRDHFHRDANRLIKINASERRSEEILSNAMAESPKVSPDGKRILFTREGERWWRKGYEGERSAQVWMLDLETQEFSELLHEGVECMWPQWMPNGKGFYFTKGTQHGFDLWRYRFAKDDSSKARQKQIAGFEDDSIVFPAISRNGKTIVFRHLFDLYSLAIGSGERPKKIELALKDDIDLPNNKLRREFSSATDVTFSADGLDIAIVAGGDIWVLDTKLREPQRVTKTAGYEDDIVFSPDGSEIWFTSVEDGKVDLWKASRKDSEKYWWQNTEFDLEQITNDMDVESSPKFTPDAKSVVFQEGRGNLAVLDVESHKKRTIVRGFSGNSYDISSDSRWIAYSQQDNDFNSEIWITSLAGDTKPVNVSRHPDNDTSPRFSPDGKILAFTGRRIDREVDIYYVYLQEEQHEETSRQRRMEEAIELMKKKRKPTSTQDSGKKKEEKNPDSKQAEKGDDDKDAGGDSDKDKEESEAAEDRPEEDPIEIDFENIYERVRRISISNSYEGSLLFSPDSKKLVFSASVDGKRGWYTIQFPDELSPKLLTTSTGSSAVWSEKAGAILYLQGGKPAKLDPSGKLETYSFSVAQESSRSDWLRAGFEKAWLTMREAWYDDRYAGHNWDEVRRKYAPIAAQMRDTSGLGDVVQLMLGELNGSHLGFYPSGASRNSSSEGWKDTTAHLGVRFDSSHQGPGLLVREIIVDGPADKEVSKLHVGDVILSIDGTAVDPAFDLTQLLNGRLDRDIHLQVQRAAKNGERTTLDISLRPITYNTARSLLYRQWLSHNRKLLDKASGGRLGYLHIRAMDMNSFYEFERQLYNVGYGRDGLVIDVRDNGGGSTTDLLLTALTQPRHAITVPRGGGQGYPHDRAVFASWSKPIIVLCNQNSYSNAEIFSHAIKNLGRGKVVGVQTAGGVISTGSATVNDVGRIRVPFRGWFVLDTGEDMERNGCKPHVSLWPAPGELPSGVDRQLKKAAELLLEEVGEGESDKQLKYAAERD